MLKEDLSCPVEAQTCSVIPDDFGRYRAYIGITNIGKGIIVSMHAHVIWKNIYGQSVAEHDVLFDQMKIVPGAQAQLTVDGEEHRATDLTLQPLEVTFSDESRWVYDEEKLTEYEPARTLTGNELYQLQSVMGPDAVCKPEERENSWICVCGKLNPMAEKTCLRCRRGRERQFSLFREDRKGTADTDAWTDFAARLERKERADEMHAQRRRREKIRRARKREKIVSIVLACIVLVLVICALLLMGTLFGQAIWG